MVLVSTAPTQILWKWVALLFFIFFCINVQACRSMNLSPRSYVHWLNISLLFNGLFVSFVLLYLCMMLWNLGRSGTTGWTRRDGFPRWQGMCDIHHLAFGAWIYLYIHILMKPSSILMLSLSECGPCDMTLCVWVGVFVLCVCVFQGYFWCSWSSWSKRKAWTTGMF